MAKTTIGFESIPGGIGHVAEVPLWTCLEAPHRNLSAFATDFPKSESIRSCQGPHLLQRLSGFECSRRVPISAEHRSVGVGLAFVKSSQVLLRLAQRRDLAIDPTTHRRSNRSLVERSTSTDHAGRRSLHYRPKERTWATPAGVFLSNLSVPIHFEYAAEIRCGTRPIAKNGRCSRCKSQSMGEVSDSCLLPQSGRPPASLSNMSGVAVGR